MAVLKICGEKFLPGERRVVQVDVGRLYDFTEMNIPVEVIRGTRPGPILFLSGAIHGDEINGVEIIRQVIKRIQIGKLSGTILAVPVVNVFGFNARSRYLPDRRDLNRSFPGNSKGSLASQMARIFMKEVVLKSTHGIDFHTGAIHRYNIPQIRALLENNKTKNMARAFGAPVVLNSSIRDGSLREAAQKKNIPILLFEGGEALRFDDTVIKAGVRGCFNVMESIGMLAKKKKKKKQDVVIAKDSYWVRSTHGGSLSVVRRAGDRVAKDEVLGVVQDLFGRVQIEIRAEEPGIIIGRNRLPLINKGDALFHIATFKASRSSNRKALIDS